MAKISLSVRLLSMSSGSNLYRMMLAIASARLKLLVIASPYWLGVVKRLTLAIAANVSAACPQSKPLAMYCCSITCNSARLSTILALASGQLCLWAK